MGKKNQILSDEAMARALEISSTLTSMHWSIKNLLKPQCNINEDTVFSFSGDLDFVESWRAGLWPHPRSEVSLLGVGFLRDCLTEGYPDKDVLATRLAYIGLEEDVKDVSPLSVFELEDGAKATIQDNLTKMKPYAEQELLEYGYSYDCGTLFRDVLMFIEDYNRMLTEWHTMFAELYGVVNGTAEAITQKPKQSGNSDTQANHEQQPTRPAGKRGRPSKTFVECMSGTDKEARLKRLHEVMSDKRGKAAALCVFTAQAGLSWLTERPSYEAVKNEFGDIGAKSSYNTQYSQLDIIKNRLEILPFKELLLK